LISLRKSIDERDAAETRRLLDKAFDSFLSAIDAVAEYAVEVEAGDLKGYRARLEKLRNGISADRSVEALERASKELERELAEYNGRLTEAYAGSKEEIQKIATVLQGVSAGLADRQQQYGQEFEGIAAGLERTALIDDLRQIRVLITSQVGQLRGAFESMTRENASMLEPLQAELRSLESRMQQAERLAALDALTNLPNRREGERLAEELIRQGLPLCLIILDLNRFKLINDRYGHSCGDQVLQQFAKRLASAVRAGDVACRWGGDEFLLMLKGQLPDAIHRSRQLASQLHGRYPLVSQGRKIEVEISASFGVAQCQKGDSISAAFERADTMLYQIKGKR
jgi:diguanylate cyclase (GGDEF)-like protein